METAAIVRTNGEIKFVDFEIGKSYSTLSDGVGGYIECVSLDSDFEMWVNEEGKLIGLPVNELACDFFWNKFGYGTDIIVGDVVFTGGVDEEGDTLGLSDEYIALLQRLSTTLQDLSITM